MSRSDMYRWANPTELSDDEMRWAYRTLTAYQRTTELMLDRDIGDVWTIVRNRAFVEQLRLVIREESARRGYSV